MWNITTPSVQVYSFEESKLSADLSSACSTGISQTSLFASSYYIAPFHADGEREASHPLLKSTEYQSPLVDFEKFQPIFGLGTKQTATLITRLLKSNPFLHLWVGKARQEVELMSFILKGFGWRSHQTAPGFGGSSSRIFVWNHGRQH